MNIQPTTLVAATLEFPFVIHEEVKDISLYDLHKCCDFLGEMEEELEIFLSDDDPRLDAVRTALACVLAITGDRVQNNRPEPA